MMMKYKPAFAKEVKEGGNKFFEDAKCFFKKVWNRTKSIYSRFMTKLNYYAQKYLSRKVVHRAVKDAVVENIYNTCIFVKPVFKWIVRISLLMMFASMLVPVLRNYFFLAVVVYIGSCCIEVFNNSVLKIASQYKPEKTEKTIEEIAEIVEVE